MAAQKAGRYELREELGRGAMGVVFKAFDPMIGRTVAVKTMRFSEEGSGMVRPELVARFQTEARAAGQLVHPNIVVIYDAGEAEGIYYITMEFVEGRSLQSLIDQKQPFPLPRIMRIMGQVCSALEFAHQRNVVHRDVKPANIVLSGDDTVKITDFGTAKILQLGTTQSGTIVGTPSYMSPEQIKGKPVDGRCDIFSLGVILYELVTGEKPFPGESVTTVIYKIVNEEPISPRELDHSVHPGLSQVISKALAKEPDERYQSCREMMQDLLNYRALGGAPTSAGYDATLVVVGRSTPAAPPIGESLQSKTGTLSGVPTLPSPPAPTKMPLSSEPSSSQRIPPLGDSATQVGPFRPLPGSSSLPPLSAAQPAEEKPRARTRPWLVLVLLAVLAGGGYIEWPQLRELYMNLRAPEQGVRAPAQAPEAPRMVTPAPEEKAGTPAESRPEAQPASKPETKPPMNVAKPAAPAKKEAPSAISSAQDAIDKQISRAGLADRVKSEAEGNLIRLVGILTPKEQKQFRQRLRVPKGVRVEYAFEAPEATETRPRTAPGRGEVEVFTDVRDASASLRAPDGSSTDCRTPCRFEDLPPGRYTLDVSRTGYRDEKRILQVLAGKIKDVNIVMQATFAQLQVTSRPPGADVYVNGKKQPQPTPTTFPLSPGNFRISLQKSGYDTYETSVQVGQDENQLTKLNVEMVERRKGVGWLEVRSVPPGADILIDNTNTGRKTPDRLELPAGSYSLTVFLRGYQAVRETIVVQPNQTLQLNKTLSPQ